MTTSEEKYDIAMDVAADMVLRVTNICMVGADEVARETVDDLIAKVRFLLDAYKLWDEEGLFTFPDGDRWAHDPKTYQEWTGPTGPTPWLDADNAAT